MNDQIDRQRTIDSDTLKKYNALVEANKCLASKLKRAMRLFERVERLLLLLRPPGHMVGIYNDITDGIHDFLEEENGDG